MRNVLKQSVKKLCVPTIAYMGLFGILKLKLGIAGYLLIILMSMTLRGIRQDDWKAKCSMRQCRWYITLALYVAALADMLAMLIFGYEDVLHQIPEYAHNWEWYICIALFAPISEELVFRGIILRNWTDSNRSAFIGVLLSGLLFGLSHQGPAVMFSASVFGIAIGMLYLKTGSIVPGILLHTLINTSSVIKLANSEWLDEMEQAFHSGYMPAIMFSTLAVFSVMILVTLKIDKSRVTR